MPHPDLSCACGKVRLSLHQSPITVADCCCTSCRTAGAEMQTRPGAPRILDEFGATPYVLYRKDRVRITAEQANLRAHHLTPGSTTRRVYATCCNTPMFLELKGGHWLSLYSQLWPEAERPAPVLRTMTADLPPADRAALPQDIPNCPRHSLRFYGQLLGAWVAMGFRSPRLEIPPG